SLIYSRPLYLRAAGGRIPELKRVIVAYQNSIVMDETLDRALARVFPRAGEALPPQDGIDPADIARLLTHGPLPAQPSDDAEGTPPAASAVDRDTASTPVPVRPQMPSTSTAQHELVQRADRHYQRAIDAQRAGDWR